MYITELTFKISYNFIKALRKFSRLFADDKSEDWIEPTAAIRVEGDQFTKGNILRFYLIFQVPNF